ncbi:SRPBCC family protein [Pseudonocardia acaciae]|uniref:SRPBCC family protein n=1 Tax=Pseudonocardia acaciae TaxID=551276 RepID=UPI0006867CA7|nr:SRPBCC domain-containing protein [Pseudonocardia acaciae]
MTDDPDVRHVTRSELEITASPEEVWEAITTTRGSAAWSFRADVEPGVGGAVRLYREPFGPDISADVTAWKPPHRFGYRARATGPDPTIATEFLIQAREHGSCVVRVVSSLHADGRGWDDVADELGTGWRLTLLVLRSYLTHFSGLPACGLDLMVPMGAPPAARAEVGALVASGLGLDGLAQGEAFSTPANAPHASGTIEHLGRSFVLLRAEWPCPALFAISSMSMDGVSLSVNVAARLYGPNAVAVAARERPRWREWLTHLTAGVGAHGAVLNSGDNVQRSADGRAAAHDQATLDRR